MSIAAVTAGRDIALSARSVAVVYRHRTGFLKRARFDALRNVSFDLRLGESLGVVGSNGAGKSTLLRLLAGIIRPDRGMLVNGGHSAALLSLSLGFDPNLTGRDNAILSGLLLGFRRRQVVRRLGEIIAFAELEEVIDYPLHTYSTGMRARLGFSVAIQLDPDILLIDEMLGVGDSEFQRHSRAALQRKLTSRKSMVLVSHDAETIRDLTTRALWIERGESIVEGDPGDILRAYETYSGLDPAAQAGFLDECRNLRQSAAAHDPAGLLRIVSDVLFELQPTGGARDIFTAAASGGASRDADRFL